MQKTQGISSGVRSVDNTKYLLLTIAAAIPIFLTVNFYTDTVMSHNNEKVSFIITFYVLAGIYFGRYLSQLWITRNKTIPKSLLRLLLIIIVISVILLFSAAQFSLAINRLFLEVLFLGLPLLVLSITTGMLVKLIRATIKNQLQEAKVSAEQSQSELKLLQSQLSPHFLFNTLNNIYGISLSQHEKVPGLLLKLSALLRYSVYDAKDLFVPLKDELEYIDNYIDFERLRIGDKLVLNASVEKNIDPEIKVAPLLLLVFIENAFKHAKNSTEQKIYVEITVRTWANSILFSVKNSNSGVTTENSLLNKHSGFGLDNVIKRLELLYGNGYDLKIQNQDGFYTVMLQLKTK